MGGSWSGTLPKPVGDWRQGGQGTCRLSDGDGNTYEDFQIDFI
ncbi:hypothetical protein Poly21_10650 [Allorhodopirellula heiligendammensis]|uniref:Uncharacterized protein n=1 Tax=Allorhodopirellula heiligendammensis TaxID=2714739 RepID=A0A5C6C689_9BACT|nr:hypothetical protein Poly21_10650 [Allorhodopirellula heiligendammensis]